MSSIGLFAIINKTWRYSHPCGYVFWRMIDQKKYKPPPQANGGFRAALTNTHENVIR